MIGDLVYREYAARREIHNQSVCVCVCVREREREREWVSVHQPHMRHPAIPGVSD